MRSIVEWAPRAGNKEADAVANRPCNSFKPALRSPIGANCLKWDIRPLALEAGSAVEKEYKPANEAGHLLVRSRKQGEGDLRKG